MPKFINLLQILDRDISYKLHLQICKISAISVLVPIYNKQKYLDRCFNSLLKQTFQDIEIIAIDDYSQDNSTEIILQKMQKDHRIKLVQHEYNQGTCNTRIHGALSASGEYIMSLDPDDLYYLNTTEFAYKAAKNLHADVVDILIELRHKTNIIHKWIPCVKNYTQNDNIVNDLSIFSFGLTPWNIYRKCVKTEIYKRAVNLMLPFVESKHITIAEDLIHCGLISLFSNNSFCMDFVGYIYYYGLSDSSHTDTYQSHEQNQYQKTFSYVLLKYFFSNRKRIEKCNLNDFLKVTNNFELYHNLTNVITKPDRKKCNIHRQGFNHLYFEKQNYCLIYSD